MSNLRPSCDTTTLLKVVVRDVGGAVPQRERRSRIHTAHRLGNRAGEGAILAGAVADVFADVGARPCFTLYTNLHFTPIARRPLGMQVARRLEAPLPALRMAKQSVTPNLRSEKPSTWPSRDHAAEMDAKWERVGRYVPRQPAKHLPRHVGGANRRTEK